MTERKLASVREIKEIRSIPDADRIVCAVVDGWELVTQKDNNFKPGDKVIYFEIDSLLPLLPEYSFLEKYKVNPDFSVNGEGYRLKTIRFKKQISQGLILPLPVDFKDKKVGTDLTELLGVKLYEKPLPAQLRGKVKGNFPSFIPKTDQDRIQNCFNKFQNNWKDHQFEVSVKLDGSSLTAYYNAETDTFGVCSRNYDLDETEDNAFWIAARKYNLKEKMRDYGASIAIQGELMGPGVQGNRENLPELDLFVFDIWDIANQQYLTSENRFVVVLDLGLKEVPILSDIETDEISSVQDFLDLAEGESLTNPKREGLVFKSMDDPSVSFKVISNSYLMDEK